MIERRRVVIENEDAYSGGARRTSRASRTVLSRGARPHRYGVSISSPVHTSCIRRAPAPARAPRRDAGLPGIVCGP